MAAASFLAPLNSSMLAVALPDIRGSFGVSVATATWLVSAYLVSVAVAQPVGGRLGDAFGCRRVILLGLTVLFVSSLGAAVSPNYATLLVTRSLQGVSAALVMPTAIAYLRKSTPAARLGSVLGANGAAVSLGAALGPVIGAALLIAGGWRLLFLINVPIALLALVLVLRVPADAGNGRRSLQFDAVSLLALAGVFIGMAVLGSARRLDDGRLIAGALAILPVAVVAYLVRYRIRGAGVVDLHLFTKRTYGVAATTVVLTNLVMYTALIAIPIYLADVRGAGDGVIGGLLFAMSAAIVVISPASGRWADRVGARTMIVAGASVMALGAGGLIAAVHDWPVAVLILPLGLAGLGLGLCSAAQQAAALKAWPGAMAGSAAGTLSMMRYVGSVSGTGLIAFFLTQHPVTREFEELFAVLAALAVVGVLASLAMPHERADHRTIIALDAEPELAGVGD